MSGIQSLLPSAISILPLNLSVRETGVQRSDQIYMAPGEDIRPS